MAVSFARFETIWVLSGTRVFVLKQYWVPKEQSQWDTK